MLPITANLMPAVRTRQALLILDFQNDFVSSDGALAVADSEDLVARTLDFVRGFRESGVGDVVWVRSEFKENRSLSADGEQIMTSGALVLPQRAGSRSSRGRTPTSGRHDEVVQETDEEAFLSFREGSEDKVCVKAGTHGAQFVTKVEQAMDSTRDIVITKSHYSAFASGQQLVQTLRGRFVTDMYVCGALSNISVYATALDGGKHGYDMTIVEDCCGYRDEMRHMNAIRRIGELLGSEPMTAQQILDVIRPKPPPKPSSRSRQSQGRGGSSRGENIDTDVASARPPAASTGLSPLISSVSLNRGLDDSVTFKPIVVPRPEKQSPQSEVPQRSPGLLGESAKTTVASNKSRSPSSQKSTKDTPPLEAEAGLARGLKAPLPSSRPEAEAEAESGRDSRKRPADADRSPQKGTFPKSIKLPDRTRDPSMKDSTAKDVKPSQPTCKKIVEGKVPPSASPAQKEDLPEPKRPGTQSKTDPTKSAPMEDRPEKSSSHVSEPLCEGDCTIITDVLPESLAELAFECLKNEVSWASMSHLGGEVPRRVAVQCEIHAEGSMPVYRHPSDESPQMLPFSSTVLEIKKATEKHLGHPLNHVLIQHYRSGNDYISEHSDKTLDIVRGSFIANVSLGAQRTMIFRTKRVDKDPSKKTRDSSDGDGEEPASQTPKSESKEDAQKRQVQRAALPHNSLCRMGLKTNERWLHAIKQDKRAERDKMALELAYNGERISLTFRHIGTFVDSTQSQIWGQGATGKTRKEAQPVVNGQTPEAVKMLQAFGNENHSSGFDWEARYGKGFNVVHMGTPKRFCRGPNLVFNMRIDIALAELGISFASGAVASSVRFEDNDVGRAVLEDVAAVLLYLDAAYGSGRRHDHRPQAELAKQFQRFTSATHLWNRWSAVFEDVYPEAESICGPVPPKTIRKVLGVDIKGALAEWESWAEEEAKAKVTTLAEEEKDTVVSTPFYLAGGNTPSIVDYACWPTLHEIRRMCGEDVLNVGEGYLARYHEAFKGRGAVAKVLSVSQSAFKVDKKAEAGKGKT